MTTARTRTGEVLLAGGSVESPHYTLGDFSGPHPEDRQTSALLDLSAETIKSIHQLSNR